MPTRGYWLRIWENWHPETYWLATKMINLCIFLPRVVADKLQQMVEMDKFSHDVTKGMKPCIHTSLKTNI